MNLFKVKSFSTKKIKGSSASVIELEYAGMGQIKEKARKNELETVEMEVLRNYEYQ